jgi:hypothetical protein
VATQAFKLVLSRRTPREEFRLRRGIECPQWRPWPSLPPPYRIGTAEDFPLSRRLDLSAGLRCPLRRPDSYSHKFLSQNKLHLTAHELADFRLVSPIMSIEIAREQCSTARFGAPQYLTREAHHAARRCDPRGWAGPGGGLSRRSGFGRVRHNRQTNACRPACAADSGSRLVKSQELLRRRCWP